MCLLKFDAPTDFEVRARRQRGVRTVARDVKPWMSCQIFISPAIHLLNRSCRLVLVFLWDTTLCAGLMGQHTDVRV